MEFGESDGYCLIYLAMENVYGEREWYMWAKQSHTITTYIFLCFLFYLWNYENDVVTFLDMNVVQLF